MAATAGEETVARLLSAYEARDPDGMLECFTDEAAYHAMGMHSVEGKDELRKMFTMWADGLASVDVAVHHQLATDTIVMHERTDRPVVGDREMEIPVAAMFDVDGALITAWREYFDNPQTP
jgi:limonene-1,2-epoxide hydrolase